MSIVLSGRQGPFQKQGLYDPRFEHSACGVGFVCNIKGRRSHAIVRQGLDVLLRLSHRGATGADPQTGDGAGLLIQTPHRFFLKACAGSGISLPGPGQYGTGIVFLPRDSRERAFCKQTLSRLAKKEGAVVLGWREVPVDNTGIGETARSAEPIIEQVFVEKVTGSPGHRVTDDKDNLGFERSLYIIRKQAENIARGSSLKQKSFFYITNISSRTFSYKGLLMPEQLEGFFPDLKDEAMDTALCLVHSRYSTNTFPTWDLAQPFRFLAHNGEINTLRGNINWMRAREGLLQSAGFSRQDIEKIRPIIVPEGSDSATIDNAFELLSLSGRSLAHTMMMLIPAAWEDNHFIDERLRGFYQYHSCLLEPWDGPAAIAFTDGKTIGAVLDRNGLRPARYIVTRDGLVVMASEVGVLDIAPQDILSSGRLKPGRIFLIDTEKGRIVDDAEIKRQMAGQRPYAQWVKENLVDLADLRIKPDTANSTNSPPKADAPPAELTKFKVFGWTREDFKVLLKPMAEKGHEPTGSMGNDTPHSVLSPNPQLIYNYFKQLFAQVTNPAIDPIREQLVMSLESYIGPGGNILEESPRHCRKLKVSQPVLTNEQLAKIVAIDKAIGEFKTATISTLFRVDKKGDFSAALDRICREADDCISRGYTFVVLSDRGVDKDYAPLPALVAVGCLHHYLVKRSLRTRIAIIAESGEPREVHHFALLFGYGADCVNPYLAYEGLAYLLRQGLLEGDFAGAQKNYIAAVNKGLLKILSRMGISTLQSYRGAQIFEALGLGRDVVERCFCGTPSRIGGVGFDVLADEARARHSSGYNERLPAPYLSTGGIYQWKRDGEFHLWNPETISALRQAARNNDYGKYKEFAALINDQSGHPTTLRSLLKFGPARPIDISEVEPAEKIFARLATGAMSFGSISKGAHESLAIAMNRLGGRSNTGEGGEDPLRFSPLPNGDSKRSAIKQVASGRFGVSTNYLVNADELQIKIAQGAKPGEGGQLPGHKVSATIARIRYTTPGVTLISPPPHHDIYSIEDLAQLIFDLKNANPRARISVKLVSEVGVGTVAAGVAKGYADMILISGADGGTGASPLSSIRHAGLPWELGLSETHQTLVLNDLRSRVRLQTDGQMRTGRDIVIAALLGAEEYGFCTAALVTLGCAMLRHCHLNTCSLGIATQNEILQKRFQGRPEYVVNYFRFVAREAREIMAGLGLSSLDKAIGRSDLLRVNEDIVPDKAKGIDLSRILYKPEAGEGVGTYCQVSQRHKIDDVLDRKLLRLAEPALSGRRAVNIDLPIKNINRTTGAILSGEVCRRYGEDGLPADTIHCKFKGVAGQSFAAFLAKGVTFELEGLANDYIGKGLSGGKVIVYPGRSCNYVAEDNIIIGNTTFYGATSGEAYIRGVAGERFCIRNSGAYAVVEGVGDHGCEYMTGGRVVVLGPTGRNFAAGMSGGIAYVYDSDGMFNRRCNLGMVELGGLDADDRATLAEMLHSHSRCTDSRRAKDIIDNLDAEIKRFVKVLPLEYKRILEQKKLEEKLDLAEVSDT